MIGQTVFPPSGGLYPWCPMIMYNMANKRYGNFQGFIRGVSKDEGRYDGAQLGLVTYDKDDNYLVSYLEAGIRCDHIGDKLAPGGRLTTSSDPLECDADLMVRPQRPVTDTKPDESVTPTTD